MLLKLTGHECRVLHHIGHLRSSPPQTKPDGTPTGLVVAPNDIHAYNAAWSELLIGDLEVSRQEIVDAEDEGATADEKKVVPDQFGRKTLTPRQLKAIEKLEDAAVSCDLSKAVRNYLTRSIRDVLAKGILPPYSQVETRALATACEKLGIKWELADDDKGE